MKKRSTSKATQPAASPTKDGRTTRSAPKREPPAPKAVEPKLSRAKSQSSTGSKAAVKPKLDKKPAEAKLIIQAKPKTKAAKKIDPAISHASKPLEPEVQVLPPVQAKEMLRQKEPTKVAAT